MPVRSLSSSVFKWPDARTVDQAVRKWAQVVKEKRADVLRIGYFGSYARGHWGVGSDLDLIIVVESDKEPIERRPAQWDLTRLPVPVDVLVYTAAEWESLSKERRFYRSAMNQAVWV